MQDHKLAMSMMLRNYIKLRFIITTEMTQLAGTCRWDKQTSQCVLIPEGGISPNTAGSPLFVNSVHSFLLTTDNCLLSPLSSPCPSSSSPVSSAASLLFLSSNVHQRLSDLYKQILPHFVHRQYLTRVLLSRANHACRLDVTLTHVTK